MMDKKAKLLSLWWFFVLVIVTGAAIAGVLIVKGEPIDVRVLENEIIINKVANCLITDSRIVQQQLFPSDSDLLNCGFNKWVADKGSSYFLKIQLLNSSYAEVRNQSYWNNAIEKDCEIFASVKTAENYPICSNKKFSAINETGGNMAIKITAGSKYLGN